MRHIYLAEHTLTQAWDQLEGACVGLKAASGGAEKKNLFPSFFCPKKGQETTARMNLLLLFLSSSKLQPSHSKAGLWEREEGRGAGLERGEVLG